MSNQGFPLPIPKPCPICGEPAQMMCGGPSLCQKHLDEQRPILDAYAQEVKELVKKYKDLGLYWSYQYREFEFLSNAIKSIYTDEEFYHDWYGDLKGRRH